MKKIKIITIILTIIAITMIAFFGVYTQVQNRMENQLKENLYAMDLKGSRNIRLKVNTESKTVIKDAEGKEVEEEKSLTDEEIAQKGYIKEEIPTYNREEMKTTEYYQASQRIIEKRLQQLKVSNYIIKLDEKTGDIIIEIPENDRTDDIVNNINTTGKFEIVDSETEEVFLNNNDIRRARVMYSAGSNSTTSGGTSVYLEIEFNKEGKRKLEEISNQYIKARDLEDEEKEKNEEIDQEEETEKKISMKIDNEEIMSTNFEEPVRTGKLQLSIGSASTDTDTLQGYIDQATNMATVLDTGNIPIKYDLYDQQYVLTDIAHEVEIGIYTVLGTIIIALMVLVIRYKKLGILSAIAYIGFISLFILMIRYTNVILSIEGLVGMVVIFLLNYMLINRLLGKDSKKTEIYKEFFLTIFPIIILVITLCFVNWEPMSSFGMVMFWGIALIAIYNVLVTNNLLKIEQGKEE